MDKFKIILFLLCCIFVNVSCSLNHSYGEDHDAQTFNYPYADMNDIYQNAADSIMSEKRFNVCISPFPKDIDGRITVICQVTLDQNLFIRKTYLDIRYKSLKEESNDGIYLNRYSTPTYQKLLSSQEEFTDSILNRVNNLSLLNCGRLFSTGDTKPDLINSIGHPKQYSYIFVYYLIDYNGANNGQ